MTHPSSTPASFGPSRLRLRCAPALLALATLVGGCGGETDPHKALQAGDGETAAKLFQTQAESAKPLEDAWCRAKFFRVEALATYDKPAAKEEANAILAQHGAALGETRARDLADHLRRGGAKAEAVE